MKKFRCVLFLAAICLAPASSIAQDRSQEQSKTEERVKASIPIKVQVVFTEYNGDQKVSTLPYTFMTIADDTPGFGIEGSYRTELRTGVRIPVEVGDKDQKTTYMDVGSNIDCGVKSEAEGQYRIFLDFDRSALYPNKSSEGERLAIEPNGQPIIHQFRASENLILKDGQTSENTFSTDPLDGHVLRVSVTINVLK